MEKHQRDDSPSGLSDIVEGDGLLGTGLTVRDLLVFSSRRRRQHGVDMLPVNPDTTH